MDIFESFFGATYSEVEEMNAANVKKLGKSVEQTFAGYDFHLGLKMRVSVGVGFDLKDVSIARSYVASRKGVWFTGRALVNREPMPEFKSHPSAYLCHSGAVRVRAVADNVYQAKRRAMLAARELYFALHEKAPKRFKYETVDTGIQCADGVLFEFVVTGGSL